MKIELTKADLTEADKELDIGSLRAIVERIKNKSDNPLTYCFERILSHEEYYKQERE